MIALNPLVPANHSVRKIEEVIDLSFIYDLAKDMYSEIGRPSDSENRYYVKDEHTKQFTCSLYVVVECKGFVLGAIVIPGNIHNSRIF
ncbi:hypothetical protein D1953_14825 [Peribacillus asahii]|uniref:Transposase InsH N-terminal domain-containing protein n=1 Tax=Peribacillus asahii TaxID=228899 RepID=A0A398B595_9BACI|nr:hypothetical protein D1953_14825 [Peribacillus asahii]